MIIQGDLSNYQKVNLNYGSHGKNTFANSMKLNQKQKYHTQRKLIISAPQSRPLPTRHVEIPTTSENDEENIDDVASLEKEEMDHRSMNNHGEFTLFQNETDDRIRTIEDIMQDAIACKR